MPVLYGVDASRRLVHLVTVGDASFDEWRRAILEVFAHPAFRPGFNFISDRRRGGVPDRLFAERTAAFAREHEEGFGRCRWAAVSADLATDDVARMIKCRSGLSLVEAGYFFDPAEARRWLAHGDRAFAESASEPFGGLPKRWRAG